MKLIGFIYYYMLVMRGIMEKIKKIMSKELRLIVISQGISVFGVFMITKLLTNLLDKAGYGYYALAISISTLISMIPFSAFDQAVLRYSSIYKSEGDYKKKYSNVIIIYLGIYMLYVMLFLIIVNYLDLSAPWDRLWMIMICYTFAFFMSNTVKSIERANRNRKRVMYVNLFEIVSKILIMILLWKVSMVNVYYIFTGFTVVLFIIVIYLANVNGFSVKYYKLSSVFLTFKDLFLFSYPIIIWASFGWGQNMINRWYLNYFVSPESVAEFSLMSSLVLTGVNSFSGIVNAYIVPIIYEKSNIDGSYASKMIKRTIPLMAGFYIFVVLILILFNKQIMIIFADDSYIKYSWMLPILLVALSIHSIGSVVTLEIFADKKTSRLIFTTILPGMFSIIGGYFLIKRYLIIGALITFFISYVMYGLFCFIVSFKYNKNKR